jgi:DnaJ-class molecular chaperone
MLNEKQLKELNSRGIIISELNFTVNKFGKQLRKIGGKIMELEFEKVECPQCDSEGRIRCPICMTLLCDADCSVCEGEGYVKCKWCGGTGFVKIPK